MIAFKYMMGGMELSATSKVLITEGYWMSRRRLAKLTAVYEGVKVEKVVDDTFKVTIKPQYDKDKNLIAGEELEYFYAPQVWKGTKVNFSYGSVPSTVVNENDCLEKTIFGKEDSEKVVQLIKLFSDHPNECISNFDFTACMAWVGREPMDKTIGDDREIPVSSDAVDEFFEDCYNKKLRLVKLNDNPAVTLNRMKHYKEKGFEISDFEKKAMVNAYLSGDYQLEEVVQEYEGLRLK